MAPPSDPILEHFIQKMKELSPGPAKLILFGSRARGTQKEKSDYDLAVEGFAPDSRAWFHLSTDAVESAPTLLKIDLVNLEEAGHDLKDRILAEGKIIHEQ